MQTVTMVQVQIHVENPGELVAKLQNAKHNVVDIAES